MKTIKVLGKLYKVDSKYKYIFTSAITDELVVCVTADCKIIDRNVSKYNMEPGTPISDYEVNDPAEQWSFKTNKAPYVAEIFHDLSRAKPIGIVQNDVDNLVSIVIHDYLFVLLPESVQEEFCEVSGSSCLYIKGCFIDELNATISELKSYKQQSKKETTYTISYPGAK